MDIACFGKYLIGVYRGYYTVGRIYEVYLRVEKNIFQEDKLHTFKPTCNFLFKLHRYKCFENKKTRRKTKKKTKE